MKANTRDKLLLHVCCGPCSEWPLAALREEGFAVDAYFYNPNIQPLAELKKRLASMRKMAALHGLTLYADETCMEAEWRALAHLRKAEHCRYCYTLRLNQAAAFAANNHYSYLTTSLQVSPYQDQKLIADIALKVCHDHGVTFLARDFIGAYRSGQEMAKADGLYRQKYCGCLYSLAESSAKFRTKVLEELGLPETALPERAL